jgi:TolB-like protein
MEYVGGGTLADRLVDGSLSVDETLSLAGQVADALAAGHAVGVVHRDLKPGNIMFTGEGWVKVVDFGIAKVVDFGPAKVLEGLDSEDETLDAQTVSGAILGTPAYMSPEQASGCPVDERSDIFSLGTVVYEMLTGRRPFIGYSTASTLAAILRDEPPAIPNVPPAVTHLVKRCLCKDISERFQTALEVRAAIEACLGRVVASTVAVLPFVNMGGEQQDDYLCDGLAEEIINELSRVPGLRVIARTSSFAASRMQCGVREIGARLGATAVLEGSVRRSGERVRVSMQLVDGRSEQPRPEVEAEAYVDYLEGRHFVAQGTPEAMARAKTCYERAIERDPGFPAAYDGLAELYWYLGFFGRVLPREAFSQGMWSAMRALELDDSVAETHALLAMLRKELDYNWPEVDRELRRALELNPDSMVVRLRYAICGPLPRGRLDEALVELDSVLQRDPLSLIVRWWRGFVLYLSRQPEATIEEGRHMIALDANQFFGHSVMGLGLGLAGEPASAVAAFERAHALSGQSPFTHGALAYGYGIAGRPDDALRMISCGLEATAKGYFPPFAIALGFIGLGGDDAAFEWMDRAVEARDPLVTPIKSFPFLDPLRADPRFEALLEKLRLAERSAARANVG